MTVLQLELNLWQQLAEAQQSPQAVDWQQLCLAFDEAIDRTPVGKRLAMAADAIEQMADVFAARADEFFSGWHRQSVSHEGPIIDDDLFAEFVRQSFHLDLDGLVAVPELYVRSASEKSHVDAESVVGEVTKETALLLAGAELEPEALMDGLEYDENIGEWAKAIAQWMQSREVKSASIMEVVEETKLTICKVWLSGLLSDLELHQTKDFYSFDGLNLSLELVAQPEVA
jgi:hypothetical protein